MVEAKGEPVKKYAYLYRLVRSNGLVSFPINVITGKQYLVWEDFEDFDVLNSSSNLSTFEYAFDEAVEGDFSVLEEAACFERGYSPWTLFHFKKAVPGPSQEFPRDQVIRFQASAVNALRRGTCVKFFKTAHQRQNLRVNGRLRAVWDYSHAGIRSEVHSQHLDDLQKKMILARIAINGWEVIPDPTGPQLPPRR